MHDDELDWETLPGSKLPFDWRAFIHKHRILYRDHGGLSAVAGPMFFRLALYAFGQAGWLLDDMLHPTWRQVKLRGPLFILGHQRSGTTFLHRLLSEDRTHARSLLFHEMLLPSSSMQNGIRHLAKMDQWAGGRLATGLADWQEKKLGPMDNIHRIRFDEVEEDEFVLWTIYASAMCINDSPISTADSRLDDLRYFERWSTERQMRALGYYRACLLKKIHREPTYAGAAPPWGLSKNPAFTQKIPALVKVFPDAKLILLVRNPLSAIPSRLSLIREIWRNRFPGFDQMTKDQVDTIVEDSCRTYLYAQRDLPKIPDSQKLVVPYDELTKDPKRVVQKIYSHFGLDDSDQHLQKALAGLSQRKKEKKSKHQYSLEEFFLDEKDLRKRLAPVFDEYDFD